MLRRTFLSLAAASAAAQQFRAVERWDVFELTLRRGPPVDDSLVPGELSAIFQQGAIEHQVDGFSQGGAIYGLRFMPDREGEWTFETRSNVAGLSLRGRFTCIAPSGRNHGPVRVRDGFHFGYADGTPFRPVGTTCYAWTHQGDDLERRTLETLRSAPFNKIRMCVFPKHYTYNRNEPLHSPYERDAAGKPDFTRFNPTFFANLERRILALRDLGIEADLILFHPYDRWGYAGMGAEHDERYLRQVVARFAAYRNVWWSMANEFNFVKQKTVADWDRLCRIVKERDPYGHLLSVHNGGSDGDVLYDHHKPWITHVSIQSKHLTSGMQLREQFRKPVIFDECYYEGDIPQRWGNISGQEMVRRFWLGTVNGCYVGHGETYLDPREILWWSKGGVLHGESPPRIAFLRKILDEAPAAGLTPLKAYFPCAAVEGRYYLYYLDIHRPRQYTLELPKEGSWSVDVIDPWAMTISPVAATFQGSVTLDLPGRPGLALRVRRVT